MMSNKAKRTLCALLAAALLLTAAPFAMAESGNPFEEPAADTDSPFDAPAAADSCVLPVPAQAVRERMSDAVSNMDTCLLCEIMGLPPLLSQYSTRRLI